MVRRASADHPWRATEWVTEVTEVTEVRAISTSNIAHLFFHNGAQSGFEMCFGPGTLDARAKTRLESE